MPLKILDRYVIEQYFWMIVSSSLIVLAVIFCTKELSAVLEQVITAGTSATIAILISLMCVPAALLPCVPAALLVATLILFYRQSIDGEILGLAVSGVSFGRMLRTPVLVAVLGCLFCFLLQEFVVPQSRQAAKQLFIVGAYKTNLPVSRSSGTKVFYDDSGKLERVFIVPQHDGKQLNKVIVLDFSKTGKVQLMTADSGLWQNGTWVLKSGHSYDIVGSNSLVGSVSSKVPIITQTAFERLTLPQLHLLTKKVERSIEKYPDMTTLQLIDHIKTFRDPASVPPNLVLVLHQRFSRPCAPLFLVLAGVPLAIVDRRTRFSKGFIYAGLLLFCFYALEGAAGGLVNSQRLVPLIAAWLPNFVCCIVALVLVRRKAKQI